MTKQLLLLTVAACAAASTAAAHETKIERKEMCVCSTDGQNMPPGVTWNMEAAPPGDQDVQIMRSGGQGEDRVVIIRRMHGGHDNADTNKDGKVTRREFLKRAEKHFDELDSNGDGSLDQNEARPPMPPLPPMPPMPPGVPPVPPVPPAPPTPPGN